MRRLPAFAASLVLFPALFLARTARALTQPERAMTVDEIVAKNVAAHGGEAKLKSIQSLRLTGKASFTFGDNQIEAVWAQIQKRGGMFRTETTLQGLTAVEAYDGKDG